MAAALQLLDTSVFVPYFRQGRFEKTVEDALEHETFLLCSVVWMELYVGTRDRDSKRELDLVRVAAVDAGRIISPTVEDFFRAGQALSYRRRTEGALKPGDHLCDLLICLCAAAAGATLVAADFDHMRRWQKILARSGLSFALDQPK